MEPGPGVLFFEAVMLTMIAAESFREFVLWTTFAAGKSLSHLWAILVRFGGHGRAAVRHVSSVEIRSG